MYHTRSISRGPPSLCRGAMRAGHPFHHHGGPPVRQASFFPPGPPLGVFGQPARGDLFPRGGDFFPLFRFMDDGLRALDGALNRGSDFPFATDRSDRHQVFNPRFDVTETEGSYELRGELPGVDAEEVEVAFTDNQTLTIKGRSARETSQGTSSQTPQQDVEKPQAQSEQQVNDNASDAGSAFSASSYQKATVEDEDGPAKTPTTETEQAHAEANSSSEVQDSTAPAQQVEQQPSQPKEHYWVSERSIGSFSRTFNFPSRINQESVNASLKNGILELSVPKDTTSQARRIKVL